VKGAGMFKAMAGLLTFGRHAEPQTRHVELPALPPAFTGNTRSKGHNSKRAGKHPTQAELRKRRYGHGPGSIGEYDLAVHRYMHGDPTVRITLKSDGVPKDLCRKPKRDGGGLSFDFPGIDYQDVERLELVV